MNKKKNHLEKIWEEQSSSQKKSLATTAQDKAVIEQLQKRIKEKLEKDKDALKKAAQVISEWINQEKK